LDTTGQLLAKSPSFGKRAPRAELKQASTKRSKVTILPVYHTGPPTAARQVYNTCDAICALDPPVQGKRAAKADVEGHGVTTHIADDVMHGWEATKLIKIFPLDALCALSGLSPASFASRDPSNITRFLLAKFRKVSYATVRNSRQSLTRLIKFMHVRVLEWEDQFGNLPEIDLFDFLMSVHVETLANVTTSRPGFDAIWEVYSGLHYLSPHLGCPPKTCARHYFTRVHNTVWNQSSKVLSLSRRQLFSGSVTAQATRALLRSWPVGRTPLLFPP